MPSHRRAEHPKLPELPQDMASAVAAAWLPARIGADCDGLAHWAQGQLPADSLAPTRGLQRRPACLPTPAAPDLSPSPAPTSVCPRLPPSPNCLVHRGRRGLGPAHPPKGGQPRGHRRRRRGSHRQVSTQSPGAVTADMAAALSGQSVLSAGSRSARACPRCPAAGVRVPAPGFWQRACLQRARGMPSGLPVAGC